ncbi:hypothetical protein QJQ45_009145 [Haematococcus lacustris]|nr:hypothetical protein QJQ45_009145 [Haematococcus lacustris]
MAQKKWKGTDKQKKGPAKKLKAMCSYPSLLLVPLRRLAHLKENNDRSAEMAGTLGMPNPLEKDMAEVPMERHGRAKQLVVCFGAASIGTRGGWGADVVLRACCKVVCRPRGSDQLRGRVVLVDEHHTTRVSSAVDGKQPCEEELDHEQPTRPCAGPDVVPGSGPRKPPQAPCSSQEATLAAALEPGPSTPPPAKHSKHTKAEQAAKLSEGKAAKAKPAPQPGRWLDRDCYAALNMQCIGVSRWRPLVLCWWPEQGALPAKGKEYPGLGYERPERQGSQGPATAGCCGTVVCAPFC